MNYLSPRLRDTRLSIFRHLCPHDGALFPVAPSWAVITPMSLSAPARLTSTLCHVTSPPPRPTVTSLHFYSFPPPGFCPGNLVGQIFPSACIWPNPGHPSREDNRELCWSPDTTSSAPRSAWHNLLAHYLCPVAKRAQSAQQAGERSHRALKWPERSGCTAQHRHAASGFQKEQTPT